MKSYLSLAHSSFPAREAYIVSGSERRTLLPLLLQEHSAWHSWIQRGV